MVRGRYFRNSNQLNQSSLMFVIYFLLWTLLLYWIHRLGHIIPIIKDFHYDHHRFINTHGNQGWNINNLLLFNDTWPSTVDLYITEVIPTLIFAIITEQYWIFVFYYLWAALLQESIEHNEKVNLPLLTSGRWHLLHHRSNYNYGLFFPLWDIVFKTHKNVK